MEEYQDILLSIKLTYEGLYPDNSIVILKMKERLIEEGLSIENILEIIMEFFTHQGEILDINYVENLIRPHNTIRNNILHYNSNNIISNNISSNNTVSNNISSNNIVSILNVLTHRIVNANQEMEDSEDSDDDLYSENSDDILENGILEDDYQNFISPFINIPINIRNINRPRDMSNVIVVLNDNDLNKIKESEYILEEDLDHDCVISLDSLKKGSNVIKLCCGHIFKSESIIDYLSKYNYKCPVCRRELGETKILD